jgi:hypothetical protein
MTDNSHYVTPEEAEKKYCHVVSTALHGIMCQGPKCMAWRWGKEFYNKTVEFEGGAFIKETWRHSTTHGYCGMVRS